MTNEAQADSGTLEPDQAIDGVLDFWFGDLDEQGLASESTTKRWFAKDPALDERIRERFLALHGEIRSEKHAAWLDRPRGRLATIIVLDQLSRNMFRDTGDMFAADEQALAITLSGIEQGMDRALPVAQRVFFYMPLMHSEDLALQERGIAVFEKLRDELDGAAQKQVAMNVKYAEMHRDIVKRFGRFPHRNALLDRPSSKEEVDFLQQPGSSF